MEIKTQRQELEEEPFWSKTSCLQIGYGLWANLSALLLGMAFGYTAVSMPELKRDPVLKPSLSDEAWIASVLTFSAPFGCFLSGYCMDKCGRRAAIIWCEAPIAVGYLCVGLAQSTNAIIIGRNITGIGIGMAMVPPRVFCTEICLPRMRGMVAGAFSNILMGCGLIIQAVLGKFVSWRMMCYISFSFSVFLLIFSFILLPESPYYLLMKNDLVKAKENLAKIRSKTYDIESEMESMISFKDKHDIHRLKGKELIWALFSQTTCKPFWIILIYCFLMQMSGVAVLTCWTVDILEVSRSTFDASIGNVINQVIRTITALVVTVLMNLTGRRVLGIVSAIGAGVCIFILGLHEKWAANPKFWPQVYTSWYTAFTGLGYLSIPFLVMSELYPLQVRGSLGGITIALQNWFIFGANKAYPYIRRSIGIGNTFIIYGVSSLLCAIFLYFFLPETKGLSVQQTEELFNKQEVSPLSRTQMSLPDLRRKSFKDKVRSLLVFFEDKRER